MCLEDEVTGVWEAFQTPAVGTDCPNLKKTWSLNLGRTRHPWFLSLRD